MIVWRIRGKIIIELFSVVGLLRLLCTGTTIVHSYKHIQMSSSYSMAE